MTDTFDDEDQEQSTNWRRDLERRAREGDQAKEELAKVTRRMAFVEAGIPVTDPKMRYFINGYEGELTADAIKAQAIEDGFLAAEGESESDAPNPVADNMETINNVAGSQTGTPAPTDQQLAEAYQSGGAEGLLDLVEKMGVPVTTRQG